jgi:hypothetical protein
MKLENMASVEIKNIRQDLEEDIDKEITINKWLQSNETKNYGDIYKQSKGGKILGRESEI